METQIKYVSVGKHTKIYKQGFTQYNMTKKGFMAYSTLSYLNNQSADLKVFNSLNICCNLIVTA
jgi:hypothetical protein